jgi:hypothetical protein
VCRTALIPVANAVETAPALGVASVIETDRLSCGRDTRTKRTVRRRRGPDPVDVVAQDSAVIVVKGATRLVLLLADGLPALPRNPRASSQLPA